MGLRPGLSFLPQCPLPGEMLRVQGTCTSLHRCLPVPGQPPGLAWPGLRPPSSVTAVFGRAAAAPSPLPCPDCSPPRTREGAL